jgi:UDP-N-acetylmuramyl pentapeptide phosphotransferase/UDP-N-acetylglucosamine-1-phosphate transferase
VQIQTSLMTPTTALYAGTIAILTLGLGIYYRRTWLKLRDDGVTPTGFGVLIAPVMLGAALLSGASTAFIASLIIILLGTAFYWLDDIMHLSARVRFMTSFVAGVGVGFSFFYVQELGYAPFVAMLLAAGCICISLTNMVNFYDGADLNLATFILLIATMILLFMPADRNWSVVALALMAFILPFGIMNRRPRTIYLGDSGSFAIAGLLTIMAVAFLHDFGSIPPEIAIPAALPTLDVAYVFAVRVIEKHDMLTRNYLHLYQRLNRRHKGFGYLLPQIVNLVLCIVTASLLQLWGITRIWSVIVAMAVVTPTFYFVCRWKFLAGPAEGPLYELTR